MIKNMDFLSFEKYCVSAIYFLKFEKCVVYVGMSKNIASRIIAHITQREKVFDEVEFIECAQDDLEETEKYFIEFYKPKYNASGVKTKYPSSGKSKKVCSRCGRFFDGSLLARYCSRSCESKAYRERKKRGATGNKSAELRTCARCGVQFEGALHGRYHSDACKQAAYRERKARNVTSAGKLVLDSEDEKT